jgi:hypothetical protein
VAGPPVGRPRRALLASPLRLKHAVHEELDRARRETAGVHGVGAHEGVHLEPVVRTFGLQHLDRRREAADLDLAHVAADVDPENRTRVGVLMDVPDMDAMVAAMDTEAAAEAMAHDGVLPETLVILVEA